MKKLKSHLCFGGEIAFWEHDSITTKTKMKFSTFKPPGVVKSCLIWLSGLTCSEENFILKAGAQENLAKRGMMVICPDTSPRGLDLPGVRDSWDFGEGAGFYVNALTNGYRDAYRMYDYINDELYNDVAGEFKCPVSISGHSMGGHGALVIGLRNPQRYRSISAFSPIVHPSACPWGVKALTGYLGEDRQIWKDYDACELLERGLSHPRPILIDQGLADPYLEDQLKTDDLVRAGRDRQSLRLRYQPGYDHSYYFISTFIADHINWHADCV